MLRKAKAVAALLVLVAGIAYVSPDANAQSQTGREGDGWIEHRPARLVGFVRALAAEGKTPPVAIERATVPNIALPDQPAVDQGLGDQDGGPEFVPFERRGNQAPDRKFVPRDLTAREFRQRGERVSGVCEFSANLELAQGEVAYHETIAENPITCERDVFEVILPRDQVDDFVRAAGSAELTRGQRGEKDGRQPEPSARALRDVTVVEWDPSFCPNDEPTAWDWSHSGYRIGFTKSMFIDPVCIVIVSNTENLMFDIGGYPQALWTYPVTYSWNLQGHALEEFHIESDNEYIWGDYSRVTASHQTVISNTDFFEFVLDVADGAYLSAISPFLSNGLLNQAAVFLACGSTTAPAKFEQRTYVTGLSTGGMQFSYWWRKSGACVNLTHHAAWYGYDGYTVG